MKPRETADIRVSNLQAVLEALQRADGATRTGLAAATGLSLMSISNLVDQLSRSGLVRVEAQAEPVARKGAGRRAELLHRLRRRHGPVVDIPGNDDGVRLMLLRQLCDLCKDIFLVFPEIPVYQLQSDMQVG